MQVKAVLEQLLCSHPQGLLYHIVTQSLDGVTEVLLL